MRRLGALFARVAAEQDAALARSNLAERLAERFRDAHARPVRKRRAWALAFAAAAAAAVTVAVAARTSTPELGVRVGHSTEMALVGAWLGASESKSLPLGFSDGSEFELAPRAKARVVELRQNGARVELASGKMHVQVAPHHSTDYRLVAGPFVVHVTGTRFDMAYSPERDAFELYLEEGQVEIRGCVFGKGRMLAAGQSVTASCSKPSLAVRYGRPHADAPASAPPRHATAVAPAPAPAATEPAPKPVAAADRRVASPSPASPASPAPQNTDRTESWRALASAGAHRDAFAMVEANGFEAECSSANADTLGLLADLARQAGSARRFEHALVTLRARFPGTSDAALAAFRLGRLEFDERRSYGKAASWFETYLRERPSGSMAREALGRLMEARYRAGELAAARGVAARYGREYPSGPHAELASRIASSP